MSTELTQSYSAAADAYEELWAPELFDLSTPLLDRLPLLDVAGVVEVGAGVGMILSEITRRAPQAFVAGVDLSEGMIARAPRELATAVMDARALGFAAESFDVAIAAFMLFHVQEPAAVVAEIARVLRTGGRAGTTRGATRRAIRPSTSGRRNSMHTGPLRLARSSPGTTSSTPRRR